MRFTIVGMGPGSREYLLPVAQRAVDEAEILFGAPRLLALYPDKEGIPVRGPIPAVLDRLDRERRNRLVAVLVSGDPCLFSLQAAISERFDAGDFEVIPGLSSFQLACARAHVCWEGMRFVSVHGRSLDELEEVGPGERAVIFTDRDNAPWRVAAVLRVRLGGKRRCIAAQDVGGSNERVVDADLDAVTDMELGGNSVVILP